MENTILINEFFPDPIGADLGYEWLEIVNISEDSIDISSWEIQSGGKSYSRAFRFPEGSKIEAGEYILICEEFVEKCNHYTSRLGMQNGINKTDGVRILDSSGSIVNTVLYSKPNINGLKNDLGEIEIEGNIIEMPPEGYSFARKDFSDTGFSVKDFFVTNSPTPGRKNVSPENRKILISEVAKNYIEFYTPNPPTNTNEWYLLVKGNKVYLENTSKKNFFTLEIQIENESVFLYSPEGILFDTFLQKRISENFSYCRLNSKIEEEFVTCEETKGLHNFKKEWIYKTIQEVMQINQDKYFVTNPCVIYNVKNSYVISDETHAYSFNCEDCKLNTCYVAEFNPVKDTLYIIEKTEYREIPVKLVTNENYLNLLNNVVKIEVKFLDSNPVYTYFSSDIGLIRIKGGEYSQNNYILKGILTKENNEFFNLSFPIIIKQENLENFKTLENTGSPPTILLTILILLLFTIFLKFAYLFFMQILLKCRALVQQLIKFFKSFL
jgi:hypothetical protein